MNRPKTGKSGGRDEPIEDPQVLREAIRLLFETEVEFSIKVEGTSTLPYAARIQQIDTGGELILKLVRPLPHELLGGAVFRAVFAVEDQRYEALVTYRGREAYLQYRFAPPEHLFHADRRRHKRYPFRPRESAYVIGSDGSVPGLGIAGPLVNIGMGGLCLRVDRVLKLDDGLRIPASTALFERGTSFPRLRVQDLPRLPLLELSGWVAHTAERGPEVLLGFDFGELAGEQATALQECLGFREKVLRARSSPAETGGIRRGAPGGSGQEAAGEPSATEEPGALQEGTSYPPLRLLRRKSVRLLLVSSGGPLMARFRAGLWASGFHRLEVATSVDEARALLQWQPRPRLLLLDLSLARAGDQEPLAAVRHLERETAELRREVPAVILCEALDPTLFLGQDPETRFLQVGQDEARWVPLLDRLLGPEEGEG